MATEAVEPPGLAALFNAAAEAFGSAAGREVPLKPPRPPKRVRVRRCTATLIVPASSSSSDSSSIGAAFRCEREAHGPEVPHQDHGFIEMPNGTGREYTMQWRDLGLVTWRRKARLLPMIEAKS